MRSTFKPALRTQDKISMVQHFEYEEIKTLVLVYYQMIKKKTLVLKFYSCTVQ